MAIFRAMQLAFFALLLGCWSLSFYPNAPQRVMLCFPLWFIGYLAVGVWLNRFQCPRCGKFYYWRLEWKSYMGCCRHCGLRQDIEPPSDSESSN